MARKRAARKPEAVDTYGAVRALCRCNTFRGADPVQVEALFHEYLKEHGGTLSAEALAAGDVVATSGERLDDLLFIQHGTVVAWQVPVSTLETPYLLGEQELLTGMSHWMATYSAYTETRLVRLPLALLRRVLQASPEVPRNIQRALFTRISRYYWTSLATSGTNRSKVAAALVSRLALDDLDAAGGRDLVLNIMQKDLCRLTNTSRPGVSKGLKELIEMKVVSMKSASYMTGRIVIHDVDRLKDEAYSSFREDVLTRLPDLL
jgi:CRP-like cAMP-binding protein